MSTPRKKKVRPHRIIPGQLWDVDAFRQYAGIGRDVLMEARQAGGVKPYLIGQRLLYSTDEFIAWVKEAKAAKPIQKTRAVTEVAAP